MMVLFLAAAALGMVPKSIAGMNQVNRSDYPSESLRKHETGLTRAEVVVEPDGTVLNCTLVGSSGSRMLDRKVCLLAMSRFKFEPAKDESGAPITGVGRLGVNWAINDTSYRYAPWTDMTLSVDQLPDLPKPPLALLRIVIDASGHVESCEVDNSSGSKQLDRLACTSATAATVLPVHDAAGTPVRAIRSLVVGYTDGAKRTPR
ncbi:MAG: TonB family protein [Janthinobacterium lividum]